MAHQFTIAVVGLCRRRKDITPWLNLTFDKIQAMYASEREVQMYGIEVKVMSKCNEHLAAQVEAAAARRGWGMEPLDPPSLWGAAVSINASGDDLKLVEAFTEVYRLVGFTPLWKHP